MLTGRLVGIPGSVLLGHYDWERENPQSVYVDIEYRLPIPESNQDDLKDYLNYEEILEVVNATLVKHAPRLIETLLRVLQEALIHSFPAVLYWKITLHKPSAFPHLKDLSLTLEYGA